MKGPQFGTSLPHSCYDCVFCDWINGYLSPCWICFLSADLALSLSVLGQLNLMYKYAHYPQMPIWTEEVKMAPWVTYGRGRWVKIWREVNQWCTTCHVIWHCLTCGNASSRCTKDALTIVRFWEHHFGWTKRASKWALVVKSAHKLPPWRRRRFAKFFCPTTTLPHFKRCILFPFRGGYFFRRNHGMGSSTKNGRWRLKNLERMVSHSKPTEPLMIRLGVA